MSAAKIKLIDQEFSVNMNDYKFRIYNCIIIYSVAT